MDERTRQLLLMSDDELSAEIGKVTRAMQGSSSSERYAQLHSRFVTLIREYERRKEA